MALTDVKIRALKPKAKPYQIFDGGGLCIEVLPSGKKVWRIRYRLRGKQEKLTFGAYPTIPLVEARRRREETKLLIAQGHNAKRVRVADRDTVAAFSDIYLREVVGDGNSYADNIQRVLAKDIIPFIGDKRLDAANAGDVLAITDRIKARGAPHSALLTRNVVKRLYDYAIARQRAQFNPASQVIARYIVTAKPRERVLSAEEIGALLKATRHRAVVHLLLISLVRKGELIGARWDEIDFAKEEWTIPAVRMKKDRTHVVYLSRQALDLFTKLKPIAYGSEYVFPGRGASRPIHANTLNMLFRSLGYDFCPHDFRRTASTHLHESGFNSDVIEKALAHEQRGIRRVYNKAEYSAQRRELLQCWADFVDSCTDSKVVPIGSGSLHRA